MRRWGDVGDEVVQHCAVGIRQWREHVWRTFTSVCLVPQTALCFIRSVQLPLHLRPASYLLLLGRPSALMSRSWTTCSACSLSANVANLAALIFPRGSSSAFTLAGAMGSKGSKLILASGVAQHRPQGRLVQRCRGFVAMQGESDSLSKGDAHIPSGLWS